MQGGLGEDGGAVAPAHGDLDPGHAGVGVQPRLYTGAKDPDYLASKYQHDIFILGFPQQLYVLTAPDSIWDRARAPDGTELVLARRGEEWVVRAAGRVLMSSRIHGSEEALAALGLGRAAKVRTVLLGGLGLGYTLRAALERAPADARQNATSRSARSRCTGSSMSSFVLRISRSS